MVGSQSAIVNQIFTTDMRFTNYLTGQKMNISDKVYFEEAP